MRFIGIAALKELRCLRRDPFSVLTWMGIPLSIALLIHLIFGGGQAVPQGRLLVADEDNTIVSNMLTGAFSRDPLGKMLTMEKVDAATGRARIDRGDGSAFLLIPKGFQDAFLRNQPFRIQLLSNPSQRILPKIIEETLLMTTDGAFYVQKAAADELRGFAADRAPSDEAVAQTSIEIRHLAAGLNKYLSPPLIELETAVAPEKQQNVTRPSFYFSSMIFMGLLLMANGFASEAWKERTAHTLRRLAATPAPLAAFLAGRLIAVGLVYFAVAALGVATLRWLAPSEISNPAAAVVWAALAGTAFFLLLLPVSMSASSQRSAQVLGNLVVFPLALVGGCFFPLEIAPAWLASIGRLTPNGWAVTQFRAVLSGSLHPAQLAAPLGALLAVGALAFLLAWRSLRRGLLT